MTSPLGPDTPPPPGPGVAPDPAAPPAAPAPSDPTTLSAAFLPGTPGPAVPPGGHWPPAGPPPGTPGTPTGPPPPPPAPGDPTPFPSAARVGAHPAVRAVSLGVGAVMALTIIALGAYAVASLLVSTTERDTTTLTGPVTRVEASVRGSLTIRPGAEGEVRIRRSSTFGFVAPRVETTLDPATGTVVVRVVCRGLTVECENQVTLLVPPSADVDVSSDHTEVEGIDGAVSVSNSGGAVELRRITGTIDARVGGGAIIGEDLSSPEVRASAGAGSIELSFSEPPRLVDAQAGAGHVGIHLPRGETTYRVEADGGPGEQRVAVATDPDSGNLIRAKAGAGDVQVDYRAT